MDALFSANVTHWLVDWALRAFLVTLVYCLTRPILPPLPALRHRHGMATVVLLLLLPAMLLVPAFWVRPTLPPTVAPMRVLPIATGEDVALVAPSTKPPILGLVMPPVVRKARQVMPALPFVPLRCLPLLAVAASLLALLRLLMCLVPLRRLLRACSRVTEGRLWERLTVAQASMAVRRPVCLSQAGQETQLAVPLTVGHRRPRIVVPEGATDWALDRLDMVLCHELAHIRRHDWLYLMLAELVRVLYVWNPLVWKLVSDLRTDAEMATDDLVLRSGVSGPTYAETLVDIAVAMRSRTQFSQATLAMASEKRLSQRITRILDMPSIARRAALLRSSLVLLTGVLALGATVTLFRKPALAQDKPGPVPPQIAPVDVKTLSEGFAKRMVAAPLEETITPVDSVDSGGGVWGYYSYPLKERLLIPIRSEVTAIRQEGGDVVAVLVDNIPDPELNNVSMDAITKARAVVPGTGKGQFARGIRRIVFRFPNTQKTDLSALQVHRRPPTGSNILPKPIAPEPIPQDATQARQKQEKRLAELKAAIAELPDPLTREDIEKLLPWESRGTARLTEYGADPGIVVKVPYNVTEPHPSAQDTVTDKKQIQMNNLSVQYIRAKTYPPDEYRLLQRTERLKTVALLQQSLESNRKDRTKQRQLLWIEKRRRLEQEKKRKDAAYFSQMQAKLHLRQQELSRMMILLKEQQFNEQRKNADLQARMADLQKELAKYRRAEEFSQKQAEMAQKQIILDRRKAQFDAERNQQLQMERELVRLKAEHDAEIARQQAEKAKVDAERAEKKEDQTKP